MSYEKTIDWSDEGVVGFTEDAEEAFDVTDIRIEYSFSLGAGLKLIEWEALDEDGNSLNIPSEKDSDRIEEYIDKWLDDEISFDQGNYENDWNDNQSDIAYDISMEAY